MQIYTEKIRWVELFSLRKLVYIHRTIPTTQRCIISICNNIDLITNMSSLCDQFDALPSFK